MDLLLAALVLLLACALIALEAVLPAFGLLGAAGLVFVLLSTYTAFTVSSGWGWMFLLCGGGGAAAAYLFGLRVLLPRSPLVLRSRLPEPSADAEEPLPRPTAVAVGVRGVAKTALRPRGSAVLAGREVDVVTNGGLLPPGTPLVVVAVRGGTIEVEPVPPAATT